MYSPTVSYEHEEQNGSMIVQSKHSKESSNSLDQPFPQLHTLPVTSFPYASITVKVSLPETYFPQGSIASHTFTHVPKSVK